jgi:hypothetical protein
VSQGVDRIAGFTQFDSFVSSLSTHDALRMIRDLLPASETESASTTAVRLMAAAKVFGRWASDISADWNIKVRQQSLDLIEDIFKALKEGPNLSELIVHERVSRLDKATFNSQQANFGDVLFSVGIQLVAPLYPDTQ